MKKNQNRFIVRLRRKQSSIESCNQNYDHALNSRRLQQVCECLDLDWDQTIPQQFDNVAQALLTFFEISTTEAWTSVMYAAVDATDVDMQPIRDANVMIVWFFMLFMLIGSYLVMNLFVGVIIDNFNKVSTTYVTTNRTF